MVEMTTGDLIKETKYYRPSINRLRFVLLFFFCFCLYKPPFNLGGLFSVICGFAPISFFILSGYVVLRESSNRSNRILRTIKRTAVVFSVLAIAYFILSFVYVNFNTFETVGSFWTNFKSKRFWFDFVVLNKWRLPIGQSIWYVQSILYAYIIIFFLNKFDLLRYDWIIFSFLLVLTLLLGEFSSVIKFNFLGYKYIGANFFTCALPYILLGNFIHRNSEAFKSVSNFIYFVFMILGVIMIVIEVAALNHYDVLNGTEHFIGMPVVALCVCMFAISDFSQESELEEYIGISRWHTASFYYIYQPVTAFLVLLFNNYLSEKLFKQISPYAGIFSLCFCMLVILFVAITKRFFKK